MRWKRLIVLICFLLILGWATDIKGKIGLTENKGPSLAVVSAALMDAETGRWLYLSNAQEPLPPASMSKMMTEVLVLDSIKSGEFGWKDSVVVSDYAANVGGAAMELTSGQAITVEELFNAMAVHSANDAAVALSEFASGSESLFVKRMNTKAEEIGMSPNSHFANSTGLSSADLISYEAAASNGETMLTAKDVAILARYLIETHPEILKITKQSTVSTSASGKLETTNEMLPGQRFGTRGNDGLKTGFTQKAGYCFTGTTVMDGRRYITVVMGAVTPESRFEETKKLLEYGAGISS
ncbi:D-alanyl-D-alanine carboxypeptidase family protein [Cohnella lupini]|uniref:D-alanyl-D-alanine carboxypeptidase (Penicillin-binding protein 5/6) n=1 Tax=Cohnella lupini TaxID=1294267 RepID=A0A3D9IIR3_9BACL|nr:D-alanyl-D-alanine carboxypeptidase family protein [Cohnella lupini]RED61628.1 D-alanyl-D-alanine carboxypeptidase (penicillin-binding protein 5/6) [Cohnella lupini]